jgi:hypothetical protein
MKLGLIVAIVASLAAPAFAAGEIPLPQTAPTAGEPAPAAQGVTGPPPMPHLAPAPEYPASPENDPLLARLAGAWTGRGQIRQTASAESERVFCKITNMLSPNGATLSQEGRCALANQSGAINGTITALGEGKYDGTLESMASDGVATLTGTRTGDSIVLVTRFTDRQTHQPTTSTTTIEVLPEGGYRLSAERIDPATGVSYTASEIVFAPE